MEQAQELLSLVFPSVDPRVLRAALLEHGCTQQGLREVVSFLTVELGLPVSGFFEKNSDLLAERLFYAVSDTSKVNSDTLKKSTPSWPVKIADGTPVGGNLSRVIPISDASQHGVEMEKAEVADDFKTCNHENDMVLAGSVEPLGLPGGGTQEAEGPKSFPPELVKSKDDSSSGLVGQMELQTEASAPIENVPVPNEASTVDVQDASNLAVAQQLHLSHHSSAQLEASEVDRIGSEAGSSTDLEQDQGTSLGGCLEEQGSIKIQQVRDSLAEAGLRRVRISQGLEQATHLVMAVVEEEDKVRNEEERLKYAGWELEEETQQFLYMASHIRDSLEVRISEVFGQRGMLGFEAGELSSRLSLLQTDMETMEEEVKGVVEELEERLAAARKRLEEIAKERKRKVDEVEDKREEAYEEVARAKEKGRRLEEQEEELRAMGHELWESKDEADELAGQFQELREDLVRLVERVRGMKVEKEEEGRVDEEEEEVEKQAEDEVEGQSEEVAEEQAEEEVEEQSEEEVEEEVEEQAEEEVEEQAEEEVEDQAEEVVEEQSEEVVEEQAEEVEEEQQVAWGGGSREQMTILPENDKEQEVDARGEGSQDISHSTGALSFMHERMGPVFGDLGSHSPGVLGVNVFRTGLHATSSSSAENKEEQEEEGWQVLMPQHKDLGVEAGVRMSGSSSSSSSSGSVIRSVGEGGGDLRILPRYLG